MNWSRLRLTVMAGAALILLVIAGGTALLLHRGGEVALRAAASSMERSAHAVENGLNRQLLQVHGALASLPTLFGAAKASPFDPLVAGRLLEGLNFQTLAYRDILLIDADGRILASARPRPADLPLPFDAALAHGAPTALIGPVRNSRTGEWSIYVARAVPGWEGVTALAEVPLRTLMALLAETGVDPRVKVSLERPDGRLIAAIPHDELQTGQVPPEALGTRAPDGIAMLVPGAAGVGGERIAVVRASLYDDIRVVLAADRDAMLAGWRLDRDWTLVAVLLGGVLIAAFSLALLAALRQRERAEIDRTRAANVLANAVEAMSDGFAMWDEEDRLVTCNQRFRDLYGGNGDFLLPGITFEEVIRRGVEAGDYPGAEADREAFVKRVVAWHGAATGSLERQTRDGRWLLMKERRTADGGIVGIRTDITALKATLAELGEANARAEKAAAEARRQNVALTEREARIRFLAHHDDLTGLPNRIQFRIRFEGALRDAAENGTPLALLYIDLDRFKDINDTLGHPVGDALLRVVAERLRNCVDASAFVARLGGDEFAVIVASSLEHGAIDRLSRRIIDRLSEPYAVLGHTIAISASIGISIATGTAPSADDLFKQADVALYQAKARGRSVHCIFAPEMDAYLRVRMELDVDLRRALDLGQFELAYQPIYELATGRLSGFEALIRWRHPARGLVSPATFVPLAEDSGMIVEIGAWVLSRACADLGRLPPGIKVAVNLSPVEFTLGRIVGSVTRTLREHSVEPGRLELEITETALFANNQRNLDALRQLRAAGTRIVLDDFGTGYSSLSHLHRFPLDKVKIDKSFVQDMTERADSAAIVEAIAALARRLGMITTAEGIETQGQLEAARRAGCTEGQGYLLGMPRPFADALELATSQAPGLDVRPMLSS